MLAQGEDIVPIPGTKRRTYLEQNAGAVDVELTEEDVPRIEAELPAVAGDRYEEVGMAQVNLRQPPHTHYSIPPPPRSPGSPKPASSAARLVAVAVDAVMDHEPIPEGPEVGALRLDLSAAALAATQPADEDQDPVPAG